MPPHGRRVRLLTFVLKPTWRSIDDGTGSSAEGSLRVGKLKDWQTSFEGDMMRDEKKVANKALRSLPIDRIITRPERVRKSNSLKDVSYLELARQFSKWCAIRNPVLMGQAESEITKMLERLIPDEVAQPWD